MIVRKNTARLCGLLRQVALLKGRNRELTHEVKRALRDRPRPVKPMLTWKFIDRRRSNFGVMITAWRSDGRLVKVPLAAWVRYIRQGRTDET